MNDTSLHRHLTLPNDIDTIPQLSEFVEIICEEAGVDMTTTMSLNLALEEAVVNVMSYAYPEGAKGSVDIDVISKGCTLQFVISDSGNPFDPTATPDIDTTLSAEERSIGGLGIHLIRQIMDDVSYHRQDGCNILTLTKRLAPDK
jgi:anti-sigma regulatory factor (Ser/Thr protein kinase)